jgi:hypothetical protein
MTNTYSYARKVKEYSHDAKAIGNKVTSILFLKVCAETILHCVWSGNETGITICISQAADLEISLTADS